MKTHPWGRIALAAILAVAPSVAAQEDDYGPARPHPWGKFGAGSWVEKVVRIEQGKEVVEGQLRLEMIEKTEKEATLKVDMSAGEAKRPTQLDKISIEPAGQKPEGEESARSTETIEVGGEKIECQVRELKRVQGKSSITAKLWFSPAKPGYRLRYEETAEREGKFIKSVQRIVRFGEKVKVGDREIDCLVREEVVTGAGPNATNLTWESDEVPGGLVKMEASQTTNGNTRMQRQMVTGFQVK